MTVAESKKFNPYAKEYPIKKYAIVDTAKSAIIFARALT